LAVSSAIFAARSSAISLEIMGKVFHILKGGFADVIHKGLHKQVGDVNAIGGGVNKVHALSFIWCVWVVFFCWFILQLALEFDTFNLAVKLVKVWCHAVILQALTKGLAS